MESLRLLIAAWLLPKGFRIAVPGAVILPPPPKGEDDRWFLIASHGRYLKHGLTYHCVKHDWSWPVTPTEEPVCIRCQKEAFKEAAAIQDGRRPTVKVAPFVERPIDEAKQKDVLRSANRGRR